MSFGRANKDVVSAARSVLADVRKRAAGYDAAASFATEDFADFHRLGLLSMAFPTEYGGGGYWLGDRMADMYKVAELLAGADSSAAQNLMVHTHGSGLMSWHATKAQKDALIPGIIERGELFAVAGSEAARGSTEGATREGELEPTGTGWRITTTKHFTSVGPGATHFLVMVALPGAGAYTDRQVFVRVQQDTPGVELIDNWDAMGMRATVSWALKLTDVEVTPDMIVGEPGAWTRDPRTFTCGYAANHVGSAQAVLDFVVNWVQDRKHLRESELSRVAIGDMASRISLVREGLYAAVARWEKAGREGWPAALVDDAELLSLQVLHEAKRVALDVSRKAFDVCGARSSFRDLPLDLAYRDIRAFTLHSRDDLYMLRVGDALIQPQLFAAKGTMVTPDGVLIATGST